MRHIIIEMRDRDGDTLRIDGIGRSTALLVHELEDELPGLYAAASGTSVCTNGVHKYAHFDHPSRGA